MATSFTVAFEGTDHVITVSAEARRAILADAAARAPYPPQRLVVCFGCCEPCSNAFICRCCSERVRGATMHDRRRIVGEHRGAVAFDEFAAWASGGVAPSLARSA